MKALIAGLGSIGRRHLNNLLKHHPSINLGILHTGGKQSRKNECIDNVFTDINTALEFNPDIVFITTPSSQHVNLAKEFLLKGIDVFIEKPISITKLGVPELLSLNKKNKCISMVGYNLRFHPSIKTLKRVLIDELLGEIYYISADVGQYLPDWRPEQNYMDSISAKTRLSGGIIFELSHEIDYIRWLLGDYKEISAHVRKISNLKVDEDCADINFRLKTGVTGNIHMDMLNRSYRRGCYIIGEQGTLTWSDDQNYVYYYSAEEKKGKYLIDKNQEYDRNEMYVDEINHYIECVKNRKNPLITLEDGAEVLKIAVKAKLSSEKGCMLTL